ncbi:protein PHYTOCHROME KINASE SUBSTRATE 3 [Jatropha curcas]|uniref:protein PHYTOCHROME KINASE SUBSTRATE 3 n=1 Tax=Jatropha curcas TaxID=180498 RepID=UPI0005FAEAD2|nr:protein PHYTOCHROME KINASE SUBSTRATE 3 [Jatropha curcas]
MDESKISDLRDASFSYLTAAKENYVLKLTESVQFPHPDIISSQETSLEKTKPQEGEINVFGAEKYFNMKLDDKTSGSMNSNKCKFVNETVENRVDHHRLRTKGRIGTPSVSSESSWNTQSALLPSSRRNLSYGRQKKVNERWFFPGFGCNRSCSDKKSVYIDTNINTCRNPIVSEGRKQSQPRYPVKDEFHSPVFEKMSIGSNTSEDYYVLPTVNSGVQNLKVKKEKQKKPVQEDPRKSLDVFGSHMLNKEDIATNLERKLSVLTWDAIPFPKGQNLPNPSASSQRYEDPESDASSDLFEIENISCSTQPIFTKQISDGMSSCMTPNSRYEPSETSIEWSVVTASAAEFSVVSEYDEKKTAQTTTNSPGLTSRPRSHHSNSLLGCKSQKALQVAETAYKTKPPLNPQHRRSLDPSMQIIRKLPADSKVKDYDFP